MGTLWVRPEPASAATVRRTLTDDLTRAGLRDEVIDDVLLVATELIGNSVRHAKALPSGFLGVRWSQDATGIRITVSDGGGAQYPRALDAAPDATSGRGLSIIDAIADRWGVDEDGDTVSVWAHLPVASGSPGAAGTDVAAQLRCRADGSDHVRV